MGQNLPLAIFFSLIIVVAGGKCNYSGACLHSRGGVPASTGNNALRPRMRVRVIAKARKTSFKRNCHIFDQILSHPTDCIVSSLSKYP